MGKTKLYKGLDLFKFISALMIVLLHSIEAASSPTILEIKYAITNYAVPFFFITSGFFFYIGLEKSKDKKQYFFNYEKRLLSIFIFWSLISLPDTVISYFNLYSGQSVLRIVLILIRRCIVIGQGVFWYLLALIIAIVIMYFCDKIKKDKIIVGFIILGIVLYIIYKCLYNTCLNIIGLNYIVKLFHFVYGWENNFVMYGVPFVGIGFLFSKYKVNIPKVVSVMGIIISTIMCFVEYSFFVTENGDRITLFFILQAIFLFLFAKELTPDFSDSVSKGLRQSSTFIYYIHTFIIYYVINALIQRFGIDSYETLWTIPVKWIGAILISILLFIIIKKINNKYLNFLING